MQPYTFAAVLTYICLFTFAVFADESDELDVGVERFGRSDFESDLPGMMFGKRELPGMMFGKRELPGMMFGKRDIEDMGLMFGKRELPGMMFGKRPNKVQIANSDELYRTMFRTMHGKRDMTMQEMQGPMFGKREDEPSQPDFAVQQLAKLDSAAFGKRDQVEANDAKSST